MSDTVIPELEVLFTPKGKAPTKYNLNDAKVSLEPFRNPGENFDRYVLHVGGVVKSAEAIQASPETPTVVASPSSFEMTAPEEQSSGMYEIYEQWRGCTRCELCKNRESVVFGSGNDIAPKYLVIGEAPGSEEERQGIPFIGPTGSKLRNTLSLLGSDPVRDGYITNSVICFPRKVASSNEFRAPTATELLACRPRLEEQFTRLVAGGALRGVLLVGKNAHISFFHRAALESGKYASENDFKKFNLKDALGWWSGALPSSWGNLKVMTVYHPSYFMRNNWAESHPMWVAWRKDLESFLAWSLKGQFQNPRVM